jgi:hypothetical protein
LSCERRAWIPNGWLHASEERLLMMILDTRS